MAQAYAIPATLRHIHLIAPHLRRADHEEVLAEGERPAKVLRLFLRISDFARTLMIDGEPGAMFGVVIRHDGIAVPWTLTTAIVDQHPKTFWKASKRVLGQMAQRYPLLSQCIDVRHEKALRWVKRLGFEVEPAPHACGPLQMPFFRATYTARAS